MILIMFRRSAADTSSWRSHLPLGASSSSRLVHPHQDGRQMLVLHLFSSSLKAAVFHRQTSVALKMLVWDLRWLGIARRDTRVAPPRNTHVGDRQERELAPVQKWPSRCVEALHQDCLLSFSKPSKRHPALHHNPCSPARASQQYETTCLPPDTVQLQVQLHVKQQRFAFADLSHLVRKLLLL